MAETVTYNGVAYRTELEARVAILLDNLNAEWEYMPEYSVGGIPRYMPDFIVRNVGGRVNADLWIEVKSEIGDWSRSHSDDVIEFSGVDDPYDTPDGGLVKRLKNPVFIIDRILRPYVGFYSAVWDLGAVIKDLRNASLGFDVGRELYSYSFHTVDHDPRSALPVITKDGKFDIVGVCEDETSNVDFEGTAEAYGKAVSFEFSVIDPTSGLMERLDGITDALNEIRLELARINSVIGGKQ